MELDQSAGTRAQQIVELTWRFLKGAKVEAMVYFIALTVLAGALDVRELYQEEDGSSSIWVTIAQVFLQYFLLVGLVRKNGLRTGPITAGAVYFGIAILSGIATVLGLLFLIVPGFILIIRWAPAYGYALVEGEAVGKSLGRSMDDTAGHAWAIAIATLGPAALYVIGLVALASGYAEIFSLPEAALIAGNAFVYAGSLLFTSMGIAIYSLLNNSTDPLASVFE